MITIQTEKLKDILEELKPLLPIHWKEIALDPEEVPLDPDYDQYLFMEEKGMLHVCTAREDGGLIGYYLSFIVFHPHYKTTLHSKLDIYYVHPAHRKAGAGFKLFKHYEAEMKRLGVKKIISGCKLHMDHGPLFEALGYKEIERTYSKTI